MTNNPLVPPASPKPPTRAQLIEQERLDAQSPDGEVRAAASLRRDARIKAERNAQAPTQPPTR